MAQGFRDWCAEEDHLWLQREEVTKDKRKRYKEEFHDL
jgi:hypothetical protein